jgi:alpha-tubulin suppressor-like RCC1 family protein
VCDGGATSEVVGLTDVIHVAAGGWHVCAALSTGTVSCWGLNNTGQLGDGTSTNRSIPVQVLNVP